MTELDAPDEEDDLPESKPLTELLATVCLWISGLSILAVIAGLGAAGLEYRPYGRMLLTVGIGGSAGSLVVIALASAVNSSLREGGTGDEEDPVERPF